jgi:hypothetical protein
MNRRIFLVRSLHVPLAAGSAGLLVGCGEQAQQAAACVKDSELTTSERSLRASLQYEDVSHVPAQRCNGCAFFKGGDASCGHCEMVSGVVSASGHCASWSARA